MEMKFEVKITSIPMQIGAILFSVLLFVLGIFLIVSDAYDNLYKCVFGTMFCVSLCSFIILSSFSNCILYSKEGVEIKILWIKTKEKYSSLSNIMHSHYIGGYWINTVDNRQYHVWLPGTRNRIIAMCEEITKHNNSFKTYI